MEAAFWNSFPWSNGRAQLWPNDHTDTASGLPSSSITTGCVSTETSCRQSGCWSTLFTLISNMKIWIQQMKKLKLAYVHNIPPVCLDVKIKFRFTKKMHFYDVDNCAPSFLIQVVCFAARWHHHNRKTQKAVLNSQQESHWTARWSQEFKHCIIFTHQSPSDSIAVPHALILQLHSLWGESVGKGLPTPLSHETASEGTKQRTGGLGCTRWLTAAPFFSSSLHRSWRNPMILWPSCR